MLRTLFNMFRNYVRVDIERNQLGFIFKIIQFIAFIFNLKLLYNVTSDIEAYYLWKTNIKLNLKTKLLFGPYQDYI